MVVTKLREMKPIRCLGIEGGSKEGEGHIFGCLKLREGKRWAMGLREMKPINFGSLRETKPIQRLGIEGGGGGTFLGV